MTSHAPRLRALLTRPGIAVVPSCFDAMSARLIERAGFEVAFMSGYAVSATQLALPDAGLISYEEMVAQGRRICDAVRIPVIGDGDTGFGNPVNVKRTVRGYHRAGFACAMIEDQVTRSRVCTIRSRSARKACLASTQAWLSSRPSLRTRCWYCLDACFVLTQFRTRLCRPCTS